MTGLAGIGFALMGGQRHGLVMIGLGLLDLTVVWWVRRGYRPDPAVDDALERALKLNSTDPIAADRIVGEAFMRQDERDAQEIAELRTCAPFDQGADRGRAR